jgi:predicted exporter
MGGVLLLAFGSVVALAVAMLPVLTGVVAGVAAVSLGFGTVHGITLGFGTTLIGEAVDYAIYYLIQVRGGQGDPSAAQAGGWRRWLLDGWPTVRLGLLTSVCGFAALAFSAFPGLAQLGVFSIAGLVAAALTTRFVLPMLMPDGARGRGMRRLLGQWAMRLVAVLPRWRPLLSALGLASAGLLLWHHNHLWRAELSSLSPVPSAALALDASLRAELSQNDGGSLVAVQADSAQAVLQATEVIGQRLDGLVAQGRIGGFESVTRLLPSLATQKARQAALPEAEALQVALAQATKEGPLPAAKLAPFVADVQAARALPLVTPEAIANTPLGPLVANLLMRRADGQWLALMPLQAAGNTLDEAAVKGALRGLNGAQWLDISGELGRLYRRYLGEAQSQALLGVAGVVLLMALWLRSGRRLLAVCQPLLVSVLLTMAGLTLLQVPLGILHMVGLLLVVAVGSNYALFFDLLSQGDQANEDTMASLLLANLTTVLSFGLIAFSAIPSLSAIGRVVAPGAALALLLSAAYAPRRSSAQA